MREIGSEFWDVPIIKKKNKLFPESTHWYLSGRNALQAIIQEISDAKSVSLPSWCCDSMIKPFADTGFEIHFYPVFFNDHLIQETNYSSDILFMMDYFGYSTISPDLTNYDRIIIRDMTHSIFSATYSDADYYFGSLRKWCGMWTGGFAWTNKACRLQHGVARNATYISLRARAMLQKAEIIGGIRKEKDYLAIYSTAEEMLENAEIAPADDRDIMLAHQLDIDGMKKKRRANAKVIRSSFPDWLIFPDMKETDCPMFVPVFVPDGKRDDLRKYLIQHEIYCPVHWPVSRYHRLDGRTEAMYKNELSIVCDQRYTVNDMDRIVETINAFWKET